ncbi:MAG TPA: PIN domain-containing protein [Polyangiaceae bacterium]|jgi:predicted nucleic acid-binding protein
MITFDTGALIALERRSAGMLRIVDAATQSNARITVPAVVLAEWWRGRATARMTRLIEGVEIEPLNDRLAKLAGEAIAAVRGATTVDAIVAASAAQRGDTIFTSDVEDLVLLGAFFRSLRVLHV